MAIGMALVESVLGTDPQSFRWFSLFLVMLDSGQGGPIIFCFFQGAAGRSVYASRGSHGELRVSLARL